MFIVKRVVKVVNRVDKKTSDNQLRGISEDITWYSKYIQSDHALFPVFGKLSEFYKIARNVGNHHQGFTWDPSKNLVILEDSNEKLEINVSEFIQKLRYLTYICELGVRGILTGFCEREKGDVSNYLVDEYAKIFPPDWTGGEEGKVEYYIRNCH